MTTERPTIELDRVLLQRLRAEGTPPGGARLSRLRRDYEAREHEATTRPIAIVPAPPLDDAFAVPSLAGSRAAIVVAMTPKPVRQDELVASFDDLVQTYTTPAPLVPRVSRRERWCLAIGALAGAAVATALCLAT